MDAAQTPEGRVGDAENRSQKLYIIQKVYTMLSVRSLSAATLSIVATKLSVIFWTSFSALKRSSSAGSAFTAAIASFLAVLTARRAVSASLLQSLVMASKVSDVGLCAARHWSAEEIKDLPTINGQSCRCGRRD